MATNHLTELEKGIDLKLKVGCNELKVGVLTYPSVDAPSGSILVTDGLGNLELSEGGKQTSRYGYKSSNTKQFALNFPSKIPLFEVSLGSDSENLPSEYFQSVSNGISVLKDGLYRITASHSSFISGDTTGTYCGILINGLNDYVNNNRPIVIQPITGVTGATCDQQVTEYINLVSTDIVSLGLATNIALTNNDVSKWRIDIEYLGN